MNVGGIWTGKEADGGGDFFAFAVTMERNQREDFVLRQVFRHIGLNNAWGDGIYADAFLADFSCEGFDGADESGFGSGVVDLSRLPDLAGSGRDDDDAATTACEKSEDERLDGVIEAVEVRVHDIRPFVLLHEREQIIACDACVIDDDVWKLFAFEIRPQGGFGGFRFRDIKRKNGECSLVILNELRCFVRIQTGLAAGGDDVETVLGETFGNGAADAFAAADDECGFH